MNSWLNESPGLFQADRSNVVEVHPDDAAAAQVADGDEVRLVSAVGAIELRARVTGAVRPGLVCVPHGWGSRLFDPGGDQPPSAFGANRNLLVDNAKIDPFSQTPMFNSTAVRLEPVAALATWR
jgi:formate dehydrogenase